MAKQCDLNIAVMRCIKGNLQQQRAGATCGIIDSGAGCGVGIADVQQLRDDTADFSRGVELAFAFAAFSGEVAHEVFVSVAQQVIAVGFVF